MTSTGQSCRAHDVVRISVLCGSRRRCRRDESKGPYCAAAGTGVVNKIDVLFVIAIVVENLPATDRVVDGVSQIVIAGIDHEPSLEVSSERHGDERAR